MSATAHCRVALFRHHTYDFVHLIRTRQGCTCFVFKIPLSVRRHRTPRCLHVHSKRIVQTVCGHGVSPHAKMGTGNGAHTNHLQLQLTREQIERDKAMAHTRNIFNCNSHGSK
eukprot:262829-Prorocentrum_minimum.AAC.1